MSLLDRINSPDDLKKLQPEQLTALAQECRQRIFSSVSQNGGHLASNLGVVELTLALHYVYDFGPFPTGKDRLLNDVGMSISKAQGALAAYLERVRISSTYEEAKRIAKGVVDRLPSSVGSTIESMWHHFKDGVKSGIWPGQIFEAMGLKYMGPID